MQRVLVTGANGFVGSHLTEMLVESGYQVKALCHYNSLNSWGWLDGKQHPRLEVVTGDVRDPHLCRQISRDTDIIFHLAALIAIPYSYLAPDSYLDTNVKGTLNICQAAKENGVSRVVVTSTSEVYGTARYVPIDEEHPKQPQSPYAASKVAADAMALSFYHAFGLPVVVARPFNTYGPRQSARAVIPTIIAQIARGMTEIKLGDLSPTRDFNYVLDTCRGFLALANCDAALGQEVNIASNHEISIAGLVARIAKVMQAQIHLVEDQQRLRPARSEVFRLWGANAKLGELTGLQPGYSLDAGLAETVRWFCDRDNLSRYKADIYNV